MLDNLTLSNMDNVTFASCPNNICIAFFLARDPINLRLHFVVIVLRFLLIWNSPLETPPSFTTFTFQRVQDSSSVNVSPVEFVSYFLMAMFELCVFLVGILQNNVCF